MEIMGAVQMATQKPLSTISYNSEGFLKEKLEEWYTVHIIQSYQYICHKGEDGDKDHIHVRIEPNRRIDPMDLMDELREFVPGQKKPLGCRPFRPSKEEDWLLYAVHDKDYLKCKYGGAEKGEKIAYSWKDIKVPETYDIEIAFIRAKQTLKHSSASLVSRIQDGEKPLSLIQEGENVYVINAIIRSLASTDYGRLAEECANLKRKIECITNELLDLGFVIRADEEGNIRIKKIEEISGESKRLSISKN